MNLQHWLDRYILEPFNPDINFALGLEYEKLGQTASAAGYYLRSVEFGSNEEHMYEALIKMSLCFERQGNRVFTLKGVLLRAISLLPKRPEAYFLLSRVYERNGDWQECYTTATIGYNFATDEPNTRTDVDYPGIWGFTFQKSVAGWWIGLQDECVHLCRTLNRDSRVTGAYKTAVGNNIINLGGNWKEPAIYNKSDYPKLRFKFENAHLIEQNYSQCYQDLFVLMMLNGKTNGTYLEVGSADPFYGNNTALLEKLGWTGISIDINANSVNTFREKRKNTVIESDATKVNYSELLTETTVDYLQIDCDPPTVSYQVLEKIPFHTHKFAVITFEHDDYADDTQSIREKSRKYLESYGYILIADDIAPDDYCNYEDWWVHPDLVSEHVIKLMFCANNITKKAGKYIYNQL